MSEQKVKDKGKLNTTNSVPNLTQPTLWQGEMTRAQALAVLWTGLQALAMNKQVVIFNDKKTGRVWFGIANASVVRAQDNKAVRLQDNQPTANASTVGNQATK